MNQQDKAAYPNCSTALREAGKAYPRTCKECGLGPCKAAPTAPPVAAPAASIDTLEFRDLLSNLDVAGEIPDNEDGYMAARHAFLAHIDAHAAQHGQRAREAGYRAGKNTWKDYGDEQFKRAEAAEASLAVETKALADAVRHVGNLKERLAVSEASLARLVAGVEGLQRWDRDYDHMSVDAGGQFFAADDVLALLPAKAQYPHPQCDEACHYHCTEGGTIRPPKCVTASANIDMQRALDAAFPVPTSPHASVLERNRADRHAFSLGYWSAATPAPAMGEELPVHDFEDSLSAYYSNARSREAVVAEIEAYGRACMALRQPSDDTTVAIDWTELEALDKFKREHPELLASNTACFAYGHRAGCAYTATATAPVSQPAAQEPDAMYEQRAFLLEWAGIDEMPKPWPKHFYDAFAGWQAAWRKPAPQPITAPAGSEQERAMRQAIEEKAKEIYNTWPQSAKYPWWEGGNSDKHEEARDLARAALAAQQKNGGE